MSRFSFITDNNEEVAYGYDRPLQEYFIQRFDVEEEVIFSISSYYTTQCHPKYPNKLRWANSELLQIFRENGVPEAHCNLLASDLPIRGDIDGVRTIQP